MTKVICTIPKRRDITEERFHAHWRDPHAGLALRIRVMRRYVQAHRIAGPELEWAAGPYEGFAEVWFDDVATAMGLGDDPDYNENLVPDEPNFVDQEHLRFVVTEEDVALAGPSVQQDEPLFKLVQLVRRSGTRDAFRSGWGEAEREADLVGRLDVLRHVRCWTVDEQYADADAPFDAVRELWWRDVDAFEQARTRDPAALSALIEAPEVDLGASWVVPVDEYRVLWPELTDASSSEGQAQASGVAR